jgi:hypothetical protein
VIAATSAPAGNRPVVLLGMPRSGTTLLRRLLGQHPALHCPGETFLLTGAARFLQEDLVADGLRYGVAGGIADLGVAESQLHADLFALADRYMRAATAAAGKRRWVMKTAIDSFYVREVEALCAGRASLVVVLRHALDVVASLAELCTANRMYLRELHPYVIRNPYPERAFAEAWRDVTSSLLDLARRRPGEVHVLRYEELVADPRGQLADILAFLGEAPLQDPARALAEDQPSGIGDWKTYATTTVENSRAHQWRARTHAIDAGVAPIVNDTLERAGYERLAGVGTDSAVARRRYELLARFKAAQARQPGG